ncbi:MAG: hypothetical protein ACREDG_00120 [Methylocella sp.]
MIDAPLDLRCLPIGSLLRTRGGCQARLLCNDKRAVDAVTGCILLIDRGPFDIVRLCRHDGRGNPRYEIDSDIIGPWVELASGTGWVNFYRAAGPGEQYIGFYYNSREAADFSAATSRLACKEVIWREGEGLPPKAAP